jgi:hypothetical protein
MESFRLQVTDDDADVLIFLTLCQNVGQVQVTGVASQVLQMLRLVENYKLASL